MQPRAALEPLLPGINFDHADNALSRPDPLGVNQDSTFEERTPWVNGRCIPTKTTYNDFTGGIRRESRTCSNFTAYYERVEPASIGNTNPNSGIAADQYLKEQTSNQQFENNSQMLQNFFPNTGLTHKTVKLPHNLNKLPEKLKKLPEKRNKLVQKTKNHVRFRPEKGKTRGKQDQTDPTTSLKKINHQIKNLIKPLFI